MAIYKIKHQRDALDQLEQALMFPEEGIFIGLCFDLDPRIVAMDCPRKLWQCGKCRHRAIGVVGESYELVSCPCGGKLESAEAEMIVQGSAVVWRLG